MKIKIGATERNVLQTSDDNGVECEVAAETASRWCQTERDFYTVQQEMKKALDRTLKLRP